MEKCNKTAIVYLATLRTIYNLAQENHWKSKGSNFYSNHLLFQRIYEETQENVDEAAEKLITLFGDEVLNEEILLSTESKVKQKYFNLEGIDQVLKIIKDFISFSKFAYNCFEQEKKLTLGLDDMIMSIASDQESHVYLLTQSTKN